MSDTICYMKGCKNLQSVANICRGCYDAIVFSINEENEKQKLVIESLKEDVSNAITQLSKKSGNITSCMIRDCENEHLMGNTCCKYHYDRVIRPLQDTIDAQDTENTKCLQQIDKLNNEIGELSDKIYLSEKNKKPTITINL